MTSTITWPSHRFYWVLLDAPGFAHQGQLPAALKPLIQDDVPADVEALHAVCTPVLGGRLAVCAAPRGDVAALDDTALVLTPDAVPPFLAALNARPEQFNLLVGACEPLASRHARRRRHLTTSTAMIVAAALLAIGMERRSSQWIVSANAARDHADAVVASVDRALTASTLSLELRRLSDVDRMLSLNAAGRDPAIELATLLRAWPAAVASTPHSISVGPPGVFIAVSVPGDASDFLRAFSPPSGWRMEEPRLNSTGDLTRLTLHLHPAGVTRP